MTDAERVALRLDLELELDVVAATAAARRQREHSGEPAVRRDAWCEGDREREWVPHAVKLHPGTRRAA
jgi:hypothetical protein